MWQSTNVIARIDWNERLFSLRLAAKIPFEAGQFIKLSLPSEDRRLARAYSLVNSPTADFSEILAMEVADGQLSPRLHHLNVGDALDISTSATGFLTLSELPAQGEHLWLLATGTGVGPFISILQSSQVWQRFTQVVLVYGVRQVSDLAYREQIAQIAAARPNFHFVSAISRQADETSYPGRITTALETGELEKRVGLSLSPTQSQIMLCGNPEMIKQCNDLLTERGFSKNLRRAPGQITTEKYW
ncbi:ferredoxin--NADP reductase [Shewanella avicenniae]|uniref:ferredoxin--NADP(+) reductase n=1 Tax=Shewanella avicenniae TaxID=2814294 RepID=A0ABX7QQD5_9GAMM|nr:ferredoxin--NADP reductase [Shewanella avicenniae]QSX32901.1 ferredoxin--NADP reductase [Shewanella avicenniae]